MDITLEDVIFKRNYCSAFDNLFRVVAMGTKVATRSTIYKIKFDNNSELSVLKYK